MGFFHRFWPRKAKIEEHYSNILEALFFNKKDEAISQLTELIKNRTDKPIAYLWLGKLLQENGELSRAEVIFENLARRPYLPKHINAIAWKSLSRIEALLGHKDKEIMALGFYSSLTPNDLISEAHYLYLKAKESILHDNQSETINYLQSSIKADPRYGESYSLLGDQYAQSSPRRAIRIWRRLLKLRPDLIVELGPKINEVYERLGHRHRYELFLRRLTRRSHKSGYPFLLLGRYYLEIKEYEHAKSNLELAEHIVSTRGAASIDLINLAIERWDQKLAILKASTLKPEKILWKCGVCGEKVVKEFLSSCLTCGNSTDVYVLEE